MKVINDGNSVITPMACVCSTGSAKAKKIAGPKGCGWQCSGNSTNFVANFNKAYKAAGNK